MGPILLVVGYTIGVAVLLRAPMVLRERRFRWFVALETATVMVASGYAVTRVPLGLVLNAVCFVVFAIAWWSTRP